MSAADQENMSPTSFLDMSDEELAAFNPSELDQEVVEDVETVLPDEGDPEPEVEAEGDEPEAEDVGEGAAEEGEEEEASAPDAIKADPVKESSASEDDQKPEASVDPGIDYEAEYKRITAPFRANGKDMQITSADDVISLMQMGANYNKKMAALKPNLKLLKLLENNGLLSEEKLSFLIDLEKKNPEAISKLVKDSGIDPLEMDVSNESGYKPKTYTVDDRELELDSVLDDIKDTPTYNKTLAVVSNKWDGPSKQVIADNPQLLKVINNHLASGVYDLISTEVERERVFGRLKGISDIEAYRQVGDKLDAQGAFNHLVAPATAPTVKPTAPAPQVKPEDPSRKAKKRAASSTKATPSSGAQPEFNPLGLSDEEFSKSFNPRLL